MRYRAKGILATVLLKIFSILPLQKKIVFASYSGDYFNDNPKAVYDELIKIEPDYKYVWLLNDKQITIPVGKTVNFHSIRAIYELATAKCWVDNKRKQYWIRKRKGQYYVQMWHGDIALKMVEKDAEVELGPEYVYSAKNDSSMADLFVSGSKWRTQNFRKSFWYKGKILESGTPKSDVFFQNDIDFKDRVSKFYGLNQEIKIVLYVPTFRDSKSLEPYNIDFYKMIQTLERKTKDKYVVIERLHPNIETLNKELKYDDKVLNGSIYQNVNELIMAADIVITDYSSCMFDGLSADKKVILYTADLDDYQKERKLYWRIEDLPFPHAMNNEELNEIIMLWDDEQYFRDIRAFSDRLGIIKCDHSSAIVANYIKDHYL